MIKYLAGGIAAALLSTSVAVADDAPLPDAVPDGFRATEETESCLRIHRIKQTKIIDGQTILFRMKGQEYYLNRLPQRCSGLGFDQGFAYDASGSMTLCQSDTITTEFSICPLGTFEKLEKTS